MTLVPSLTSSTRHLPCNTAKAPRKAAWVSLCSRCPLLWGSPVRAGYLLGASYPRGS